MPSASPPPDNPPDSNSPSSRDRPTRAKSPDQPVPPASYQTPPSDSGDPPADLPLPTTSAPAASPPTAQPILPAPPAAAPATAPAAASTLPTISPGAKRMPAAAPRRTQRSRLGRPPNINENSLMRRLECVMAVESGRMTMLTACQQYDISARTFYRWLRNKDRLIELTGFTEEDFRNSPPASWGPDPNRPQETPPAHPQVQAQGQAAAPPASQQPEPNEETEAQDNLPRLPAVQRSPTKPAPAPSSTQAAPTASHALAQLQQQPGNNYMGMKRRFPKGSEASRPAYPTGSNERYEGGSNTQAAYYARRSFTKMPPANASTHDGLSAERHAARTSTRMRRQEWPPEPPAQQRFGGDGQFAQQYRDSRSNSPNEPYKRRKVTRDQPGSEDGPDHDMQDPELPQGGTPSPNRREYPNGSVYPQASREPRAGNGNGEHARAPPQRGVHGSSPEMSDVSGKHRMEIMMGRRKVIIAWYEGASADDIKTSIARRFALLPGTQWALMDKNFDEIVISAGVPSGRYTLTVFS